MAVVDALNVTGIMVSVAVTGTDTVAPELALASNVVVRPIVLVLKECVDVANGSVSSSCAMSGVTMNDVAFALAQEKFTNCPGAAKAGDTVKDETTGVGDMPDATPAPALLASVAAGLEAPVANAVAIDTTKIATRPGTTHSLDIDVTYL